MYNTTAKSLRNMIDKLSQFITNYDQLVEYPYLQDTENQMIEFDGFTFDIDDGVCANVFTNHYQTCNKIIVHTIKMWHKEHHPAISSIGFFIDGIEEYSKRTNLWLNPKRLHFIIYARHKFLDALHEINNGTFNIRNYNHDHL